MAQRLGYDPFEGSGGIAVRARIHPAGDSLVGDLDLRDADGRAMGARQLAAREGDCAELGESLALAMRHCRRSDELHPTGCAAARPRPRACASPGPANDGGPTA